MASPPDVRRRRTETDLPPDEADSIRIAVGLALAAYGGTALRRGSTLPERPFASSRTSGFVLRDGSVDVVVFRGTRAGSNPAAFQDWLDVNLRAFARPAGRGVVHAGFADAFASVRPDVTAALRPGAPVRLIGHSMGGALALVAGAAFEAEGQTVERIITFGTPAAADPAYLSRVADRVTRIEAQGDLVPWLPPQDPELRRLLAKVGLGTAVSCDFRPVGEVVYLADGRVRGARPGSAELLAGMLSTIPNGLGRIVEKLTAAHAVDSYVEAVERLVGAPRSAGRRPRSDAPG